MNDEYCSRFIITISCQLATSPTLSSHMRLPAAPHHVSRRAFTSVVGVLAAVLPASIPASPALAAGACTDLKLLPDVLSEVRKAGTTSQFKSAKASFLENPLFADSDKLSTTADECAPSAAGEKKDALVAVGKLREELDYQAAKSRDPRWPDPDDVDDFLIVMTRASKAVDRFLGSLPAS